MGYYDLFVKVEGENISTAQITDPEYTWVFDVECVGCNRQWQADFCESDQVESDKGKSTTNWAKKCQDCSRIMNISIAKGSGYTIAVQDSKPSLLATFDCRNCSPVDSTFQPTPGYCIISTEGSEFNEAELTEEFCEYCEALKETCLIEKVGSSFSRNTKL